MKQINTNLGFFKVYWDLCQDFNLSPKDVLLLSYVIDKYSILQNKVINPEDGKTYYRLSTDFVRRGCPVLSEDDVPKSFKNLAKEGYLLEWRPNKCPKGLRFIRLEDSLLDSLEDSSQERLEDSSQERSQNLGINNTIKTNQTIRQEDYNKGFVDINTLDSNTKDILQKISSKFDLVKHGNNLYRLDYIYKHIEPLLKRDFQLDDFLDAIDYCNQEWPNNLKVNISPETVFRQDKFDKYVGNARSARYARDGLIIQTNKPLHATRNLDGTLKSV